jgi:hypothetical protein
MKCPDCKDSPSEGPFSPSISSGIDGSAQGSMGWTLLTQLLKESDGASLKPSCHDKAVSVRGGLLIFLLKGSYGVTWFCTLGHPKRMPLASQAPGHAVETISLTTSHCHSHDKTVPMRLTKALITTRI